MKISALKSLGLVCVLLAPAAFAAEKQPAVAKPVAAAAMPKLLTGNVENFLTDASLFVTAVELKTAHGNAVVNFVPGLAENLMLTYPAGKTASLWALPSVANGVEQLTLIGIGERQPGRWLVAQHLSANELLTGQPMVDNDGFVTLRGSLLRVCLDEKGQPAALVVATNCVTSGMVNKVVLFSKSAGAAPVLSLVRVTPRFAGEGQSTALCAGDDVVAVGHLEEQRHGAVSTISQRVIATVITVNGRSVGPAGCSVSKSPVVPLGYEVFTGPVK